MTNTNRNALMLLEGSSNRINQVAELMDEMGVFLIYTHEMQESNNPLYWYHSKLMEAVEVSKRMPVAIVRGLWSNVYDQAINNIDFVYDPCIRPLMRLNERYGVSTIWCLGNNLTVDDAIVYGHGEHGPLDNIMADNNPASIGYWLRNPIAGANGQWVLWKDTSVWNAIKFAQTHSVNIPAWSFNESLAWLGSASPLLIFLADTSEYAANHFPYPFYNTDGVSGYFNQAINLAALNENHIAYVDISRKDEALEFLKYQYDIPMGIDPLLCALGNDARDWITANTKIDTFVTIPSPDVMERFNYKSIHQYSKDLFAVGFNVQLGGFE